MKLDWATLANSAEATPNGLLYMMGAGWDTATRPSFPAPFAGAVALRLLFHRRELEIKHSLTVELVNEDGTRVVEISHELDVSHVTPPQNPSRALEEVPIPIALNLAGLLIPQPGRYAIEIFLDGSHLKTLSFVFQQLV